MGNSVAPPDAETSPLRDPGTYRHDFNLADVTEVWRRGSVIASWLLDLTAAALFGRFTSRGEADFQNRVLSAMRFQFGGHVEKSASA